MMNKPTVLASGDWLFPISVWGAIPSENMAEDNPRFVPVPFRHYSPESVGAHVYRSKDQGRSLQKLGTVRVPQPGFDEHMLVERRDALWLLARNQGGSTRTMKVPASESR